MRKLIVISTPGFFPDEALLIERLLDEGLPLLHLRKPDCEREALERLLDKIPSDYYPRIALHDWLDLAEERSLGGVHLNRRNPVVPDGFHGRVSRSCHSLEEVTARKSSLDYLFLSPIFPSISKEGYGNRFPLETLREAEGIIDEKVIALGGISARTVTLLEGIPFGGIAVLGAIWGKCPSRSMGDQIINQYKQLQQWV